jgi:hypothetical protein
MLDSTFYVKQPLLQKSAGPHTFYSIFDSNVISYDEFCLVQRTTRRPHIYFHAVESDIATKYVFSMISCTNVDSVCLLSIVMLFDFRSLNILQKSSIYSCFVMSNHKTSVTSFFDLTSYINS